MLKKTMLSAIVMGLCSGVVLLNLYYNQGKH